MEKVKEALGPAIKFSGIIGSITGFIGDVLSPLGPIIDYFFYISLSIFILSLVLLISKKIKKYDIKKILFSSLVLSIIFGVFGAVNQNTEQGVLGDNFEFISELQGSFNIIDEKLGEVITKLDVVDEKLETIDTKISQGFDDLSDLIKSSNHLENPTSAKDFIVNAYIYNNRGELLKSQKSFEEYFKISKKYEIDVMLDYSKVLEKNQGYSALKMFYKQLEQLEDESVIVAEMLSISNGDLDLLEQLWNKNLNTPIYKWALLTLKVGTVFEMGQNGQSMELQKKLITQSLEFHKELGCDFKNIQQYFLNSSSAKNLVFSNSLNKSPGYYNWAVPAFLDGKGLLLKTELTKLGCYRY
tara:strand:- start:280 stop:1347 length:1068 start_codon:yes stop_codon:yes gene_type:complete